MKNRLCKLNLHDWSLVTDKWESCYHFTILRCKRCPEWKANVHLGLPPRIIKKLRLAVKSIKECGGNK